MEKSLSKNKKKKRKRKIIAVAVIIILVIVIWTSFKDDEQITYSTVVAEQTDLIQEISATGRVEAIKSVDLAFEQSGRVSRISVVVGDNVNTWQPLIWLEADELTAKLNEVKASLKVEEVKLEELQLGSRAEEVAVKQAELAEAEQDLTNYYKSVLTVLNEAYIKADDAVRIKTGGIFTGYKTSGYEFTYNTCSSQAGIDAAWLRFVSESELDQWKEELNVLDLSVRDVLEEALNIGEAHLTMFQDFLNSVSETLTTSCTIDDTSLNTYRTNITTARTNIAAQLDALSDLEQSISAQKLTVLREERDLELSRASSTPEKIRAQEAKVEQLKASVENIQVQIGKTIIRSSIKGIVTIQDAKVGEIVPANTTVVSVISDGEYQIEAFVVEADIANLEVGDAATLTLDAYGEDEIFRATVIKIDPAAELLEGVANYRTTLKLEEEDGRIRQGMTADLDIVTAERENIIVIPQRAVIFKNGLKLVRVLRDGNLVEEIEVETGITGNRGYIEIVSGIEKGDVVITAIKD